jgi:hypothetical protein
MGDEDGPLTARKFYKALFQSDQLEAAMIPYALDTAVSALRAQGVSVERWATFVHLGA